MCWLCKMWNQERAALCAVTTANETPLNHLKKFSQFGSCFLHARLFGFGHFHRDFELPSPVVPAFLTFPSMTIVFFVIASRQVRAWLMSQHLNATKGILQDLNDWQSHICVGEWLRHRPFGSSKESFQGGDFEIDKKVVKRSVRSSRIRPQLPDGRGVKRFYRTQFCKTTVLYLQLM